MAAGPRPGVATADDTKLGDAAGYAPLSVQVNNINLPRSALRAFDNRTVGEITLSGGLGTMPQSSFGDFSVGRVDDVTFCSLEFGPAAASGRSDVGPGQRRPTKFRTRPDVRSLERATRCDRRSLAKRTRYCAGGAAVQM